MTQSTELAAGEGFDFEDAVAAFYLTKLLAKESAPGIDGKDVTRVSVQQRDFGEPLDDVIVDFKVSLGAESRLSLQVKQSLTISSASSNKDFRKVIRDSWKTFKKPDFRNSLNRYGVATEKVAEGKFHALKSLCESARASNDLQHFESRFKDEGSANQEIQQIRKSIEKILSEEIGEPVTQEDLHQFLSHFVIIRLDLLREGASDKSDAINTIKRCLADGDTPTAALVWSHLIKLAGEKGSKAGQISHSSLLRAIPEVKLKRTPSIQSDAEKIRTLSQNTISQIQDGIGDVYLERDTLAQKLADALQNNRFIQIRGLPGSGKSVCLRRLAQKSLAKGFAFFLKSESIQHSSWIQFTQALGIETTNLEEFMLKFEAIADPIFYLDAIDRLEVIYQPFIREILDTISSSEILKDWKVVVSLRDTGIETLHLWLGDILNNNRFTTVEVGPLSDAESEELSKAKEHLRPLLFGTPEIRQIVRRPFFAKILEQGVFSKQIDSTEHPKSEVELLQQWWKRGGYNESLSVALPRQRALIQLASARSANPSKPISLNGLVSLDEVNGLLSDGILIYAVPGVSVRFSHDIFFEWAFLYALHDADNGWISHIKECGEPPVAARSVELLSHQKFSGNDSWEKDLQNCDDTNLRSQWLRAWLFGPFHTPHLTNKHQQFESILLQNDSHYLLKILVWFQAEKTIPNPNILESNLPSDAAQLAAYEYSWPSDFHLWKRVIPYLLRLLPKTSPEVYPAALSTFEVWQNACSDFKNDVSQELLVICAEWLGEMDSEKPDSNYFSQDSKWSKIKGIKSFRKDLISLILNASLAYPEHAKAYLRRLMAADNLRGDRASHVFANCQQLAQSLPSLLVDFTLSALHRELPEETKRRWVEEREFITPPSFSWDNLSIENDHQSFYPESPLCEPFKSLFISCPEEALRLVRELCNHAMTAWCQLYRLDHSNKGTPIPLKLEFPWATELFWGGRHEYLYFRGILGPKAISCGLMAAEKWAFDEVEAKKDPNKIIRQIVEGNQCISILGVAAMVAMKAELISFTTLPIFTSQRLIEYDLERKVEDQTSRELNQLPVRSKQLQDFIPDFVFGEESLSKQACHLLTNLKTNLPFEFEEHKEIDSEKESLMQYAELLGEMANRENYKCYRVKEDSKQIAIVHESPTAAKPENIAKAEEINTKRLQISLTSWALDSFEKNELNDTFSIESAISLTKEAIADGRRIARKSQEQDESLVDIHISGIAGVAAVVLHFRNNLLDDDLIWARRTIVQIFSLPEAWGAFTFPESIDRTHRNHFIARALAADIRYGTATETSQLDLLRLCAYPLECVAETALHECLKLWTNDPHLAWAALYLFLDLCHIHPEEDNKTRNPNAPTHSDNRLNRAVDQASNLYFEKSFSPLPKPPPAWVKRKKGCSPQRLKRTGRASKKELEWRKPEVFWNSKKAATALEKIPLEKLINSDSQKEIITFILLLINWTKEKNAPPWKEAYERDQVPAEMIQWNNSLGWLLGNMAGVLPFDKVETKIIQPLAELKGEICWSLLSPFVTHFIYMYVLDSAKIHKNAKPLLEACLSIFLKAPEFQDSNKEQDIRGFDDTLLVHSFFFVSINEAELSARFANGDWRDIEEFLPLVDKLITEGAHIMLVVESFLNLCQRSKEHYPAKLFAKQVLTIFSKINDNGRNLKKRLLTSQIAELTQYFSQRETPMQNSLAQKFLSILDQLVDFGDRRSAALQQNEIFREIRLTKN